MKKILQIVYTFLKKIVGRSLSIPSICGVIPVDAFCGGARSRLLFKPTTCIRYQQIYCKNMSEPWTSIPCVKSRESWSWLLNWKTVCTRCDRRLSAFACIIDLTAIKIFISQDLTAEILGINGWYSLLHPIIPWRNLMNLEQKC